MHCAAQRCTVEDMERKCPWSSSPVELVSTKQKGRDEFEYWRLMERSTRGPQIFAKYQLVTSYCWQVFVTPWYFSHTADNSAIL